MFIVLQGSGYEIFQLPSDCLYYWRGTAENSHLDSPQGYSTAGEALAACADTIEDAYEVELFNSPEVVNYRQRYR